jgi:hypothetical protein
MIKTTPFNNKCLTKVTWQKDLSENNTLDWNDWTFTSLMPWCFRATTAEETIKAAHRRKFTWLPMETLTPLEDGSFLMTYKHGTLRVVLEQETPKPQRKSMEEWLEEQECMWHDWE